MTETKTKPVTKEAEKTAENAQKAVQEGAEKATHAVDEVFGKLKAHFETKKVDEWQKKWLAVPANRKKYAKLADAPEVVGEEALAITNDIIDFIQGEEAEQSHLFKRLKGSFQTFFKHPVEAVKKEAGKATSVAKETAEKSAATVKETVGKAKPVNGKTKKPAAKPAKK
jgi:hypothetical protein